MLCVMWLSSFNTASLAASNNTLTHTFALAPVPHMQNQKQEVQQQQPAPPTKEQLTNLILKIGTATRKLVKNQHTWFRDDAIFKWVENTAPMEEVVSHILREIERPQHEGGCGDSGRLDKDEARLMREYQQPIVLFRDGALVERVLGEVAAAAGGGK